ncbi:MAG: gamma-glutamyltransferase [Deltaproteobacteria bacterium RBG_16_49_23]|nr:MAG: gamma-glutamyltransferase [Deltaproteobacteria bacterium RBG_16_49_23]
MRLTYTRKREWESAAQRSVAMGRQGMVAASQPLATLSGYKILQKGGNAIDAAVAMVSTLSVVEPYSVGLGGDAFALIYLAKEKRLIGMNGSGRAPYQATPAEFKRRGFDEIPERGILTVTVPGALHAWAQALERFGTMRLADVFEDAIHHAENGFPVTEIIAGEWQEMERVLHTSETISKTYLMNGKAPHPGQIFVNRDLGNAYKKIVGEGIGAFYEGEICDAIVKTSIRHGGLLDHRDFKEHTTTWVEPISTDYRGYTIYELPPNGQGLAALEMLNILEGYEIGGYMPNHAEYLHLLIEAKKAAFEDRNRFITDPEFEEVPVDRLLSKDYAGEIRARIRVEKASAPPSLPTNGKSSETVYLTAVDKDRNAVSFISSLFMGFGSGVVVDGTGIALQNRGKSFSLNPKHRNRVEPHKRPMHTIIPGMVFKDGEFFMSFGVMGGDMQPQGHVQFLINLIDFGMNLQEAVDSPRIRHFKDMEVYLENGIPEETAAILSKKGHHIIRELSPVNEVGGGQAIYFDHNQNVLLGASDRRKDGCAIGY